MNSHNAKLITRIGDSLYHWANYLSAVERISVLKESAVDYAISEVLETSKHSNGKYGRVLKRPPLISKYKFRFPHPFLVKRSVDLHADANFPKNNELFSEFKYVNRDVKDPSGNECQRYFNDLFRLLYIQKYQTNKPLSLFIVAGKQEDFRDRFKQEDKLRNATGTFASILSFDEKNRDKSNILSSIVSRTTPIINYFNVFDNKYTKKNPRNALVPSDVLFTHLAYIKQDLGDGVFVAVWEVEYRV